MLKVEDYEVIRRKVLAEGWGIRRAARELGHSRQVVQAGNWACKLGMQAIDLEEKEEETMAVTRRKGISAREQAERKRGRMKGGGGGFTPMPKCKIRPRIFQLSTLNSELASLPPARLCGSTFPSAQEAGG